MRSQMARLDKGAAILVVIFLVAFLVLFKPWVHGFDTVAYYSWLRSAVIDGNLQMNDEFTHYGYGAERGMTPTGHTYNEWAVGSAILWSPFFLAAHGLSLLARAVGLPVVTDGYAAQYIWAISLGSALYAFIGLLLTYRVCRQFFTLPVSVLAATAIWLSSPLVFYMYSHPIMSHANDAFAYALLIFTWYNTRHRRTWQSAALRGGAAGLCALVRQVNAVFVFFALGEMVIDGIRTWQSSRQAKPLGQLAAQWVAFSVAWWLVYSPQMVAWRIVYGHWIELNPYASGAGVGFSWLRPHTLEVLFSTAHGLFVWTPLLLFAVLGWFFLWRRDQRLTTLLAVNFALQLYVVSAWNDWGGSAAFGQRFFTNMSPAFVLGLAALLSTLQNRAPLAWLATGCVVFIAWNALLIIRYVLDDIPHGGPMPLGELILGQFTVVPRYLGRILEILLQRR